MTSPDFARETEQAAGHLGRGSCRSSDVVESLPDVRVAYLGFARKRGEEVDARAHGAQQVIEVVSDTGSEPSDRFELTTLRDLLLHRVVVCEEQQTGSDLNSVAIREHLTRDAEPVDLSPVSTF